MNKILYSYGCKSCKTIAVAAFQSTRGKCIRCNLCASPMVFLWCEPAKTEEQLEIHAKGIVYNPGVSQAPTPSKCDTCKGYVPVLRGVTLAGVGRYCSAACADVGKERHEATLAKEPQ